MIYFQENNDRIIIFPVKKKMSEKLIVKYYANNQSAKVPIQTSEGAARYDLYAAEARTYFHVLLLV